MSNKLVKDNVTVNNQEQQANESEQTNLMTLDLSNFDDHELKKLTALLEANKKRRETEPKGLKAMFQKVDRKALISGLAGFAVGNATGAAVTYCVTRSSESTEETTEE